MSNTITAKEFCGRKGSYSGGKPKAGKFRGGTGHQKAGLHYLPEEELPDAYDHLAKVAGYTDVPWRRRPNLWGMLVLAVKATIRNHPDGLTLAEVTFRLGDKVTTKNVAWAVSKLAESGDIRRAVHGDLNFTVYVPTAKLFRR